MTPDKYTIKELFLDVGNGHSLYVQDWGNAKAKTPIIFLHGGPGSGCKDKHKATFDPKTQHVVFFDQRAAGRSLPYGSLEHNTTEHLIEDIEKIADHLKLTSFVITGGSWGSALALAYALAHPQRVAALVIHGVWTCSQTEIDWLDKGHFQTFFPDVWQDYVDNTPKAHHHDPSAYHFKRILGSDEVASRQSAYIYDSLEGAVMNLDDQFVPEDFETYDPARIRIAVFYMSKSCFMPDGYILNNVHKLKMPVWIVQGRYDAVCPPLTAWKLHKILPRSKLIWTVSGHRMSRESWNVLRTILAQWS